MMINKITNKLLLVLCITTLWAGNARSVGQWLTEENISQDVSDSLLSLPGFGSNHSDIAVDSFGNPHVVWFSGSPSRVYYSRKSSNTWTPEISFTPTTSNARFPSIAIDTDNRMHLVWHDYRHGTNSVLKIEIYYNTSTIGGDWNYETRLTYATNSIADNRYIPTILVDHKNALHCLWYDYHWDGFNPDLAYKTATGGFTWDTTQNIDSTRITFTQLYENPLPAICTDTANNIHVVWDDDASGNLEIYYKMKNAVTGIWTQDTSLTFDSATSISPCITSDNNNNLYVFWSDNRDGNQEIYLKKYSVDSNSWLPDQRLTNSSGVSDHPSAGVDKQNNVYLVWDDDRDGNLKIYFKKYDSLTQSWSSDIPISTGNGSSHYPSIAVDNLDNVHVVWQDNRNGNEDIYYRMQSNVTGLLESLWKQFN